MDTGVAVRKASGASGSLVCKPGLGNPCLLPAVTVTSQGRSIAEGNSSPSEAETPRSAAEKSAKKCGSMASKKQISNNAHSFVISPTDSTFGEVYTVFPQQNCLSSKCLRTAPVKTLQTGFFYATVPSPSSLVASQSRAASCDQSASSALSSASGAFSPSQNMAPLSLPSYQQHPKDLPSLQDLVKRGLVARGPDNLFFSSEVTISCSYACVVTR